MSSTTWTLIKCEECANVIQLKASRTSDSDDQCIEDDPSAVSRSCPEMNIIVGFHAN